MPAEDVKVLVSSLHLIAHRSTLGSLVLHSTCPVVEVKELSRRHSYRLQQPQQQLRHTLMVPPVFVSVLVQASWN